MLNYQLKQLNDLSGGITDNYKAVDKGKFEVLKNFITTDNRSIKIRNGTRFHCGTSYPVLDMININNRIYIATAADIRFIEDGVASAAASKPTGLSIGFSSSTPPQIERFKNSVIVNGSTGADKGLLLATYNGTSFVVRNLSLPKVTSITGVTSGDRLLAAVLVRKYTDADGFTFIEYGPETIVSWNGSSTPTANFSSITKYFSTIDSAYVYFYSTEENGTVFHLGQKVTIATPSSATSAAGVAATILAGMPTGEIFGFEQEVTKAQAPVCDYFTMAGGVAWYASITDGSDKRKSRAIHAVDGIPSSVIQSAYVDFDHPINGVGSINSLPIFLTDECLYRVDGNIGIDGSGFLRKVRVANSEGGISHRGIVIANDAMYYLGTDGIYVTDGYTAKNITGPELYKTYTSYVATKSNWSKFTGTFDRDNNIIYWRMDTNALFALELNTGSMSYLEFPSTYNIYSLLSAYVKNKYPVATTEQIIDSCVVMVDSVNKWTYVVYEVDSIRYLSIGDSYIIKSNAGVEYTGDIDRIYSKDETVIEDSYISLLSTYDPTLGISFNRNTIVVKYPYNISIDTTIGAYAKSIMLGDNIFDRKLLIGNSFSYLLSSSDKDYSDLVISSTTNYFNMPRTHIDFDFLTAGIAYDAPSIRKWVRDISFTLRTEYKSSVEPYVIVDDNENVAKMKRITTESQGSAYSDDEMYESSTSVSFARQVVTGKRHMPKGFCRCRSNQIGGRSVVSDLYTSDDFGQLLVTSIIGRDVTGVLEKEDETGVVGILFPYDLVGKTIKINGSEVTITALSDDRTTITFNAPSSVTLEESQYYDWVIFGYRRDQRVEIMAIDISYAMISNNKSGFNPALTPEGSNG